MARSVLNAKAAKAAAARSRMSKRAKRQRWMKENKKRLTLGILGFVVVVFLALFTPFGPDWYYGGIKNELMESPTRVSHRSIEKLYKLGVFYNWTLRAKKAMEVYDEIGVLYFGYKFSEYAASPAHSAEKREMTLYRIKKDQVKGPPFTIPEDEIQYVALAVWRAGEIMSKDLSKQFTFNIYKDLYLDELLEQYPDQMNLDVTRLVQLYVNRVKKVN